MEKLAVFYNPSQTVRDNNSFSPSAGKPEHIVKLFSKNPRVRVIEDWKPLTREEICIAHDPDFVGDILDLKRPNGFGNKLPSVADSLHYTNGSFLRAAKYAYDNNTVAMSPTSGFHHSHYDSCHGFCTFNGLMIAAMHLWETTPVQKIGIVDFDAHYGDGTQDIIDSIEGASDFIEHYTFGQFVRNDMDFDKWLSTLDSTLLKRFSGCDMLFYQAGADPQEAARQAGRDPPCDNDRPARAGDHRRPRRHPDHRAVLHGRPVGLEPARRRDLHRHPGGVQHALFHGVGTALCFVLWAPFAAIILGAIDGLIHYHVDWAKVKLNNKYGLTPTNSEKFWWLLGADQLAHYLTYIGLVALVTP